MISGDFHKKDEKNKKKKNTPAQADDEGERAILLKVMEGKSSSNLEIFPRSEDDSCESSSLPIKRKIMKNL